jgi:hypothetical protein
MSIPQNPCFHKPNEFGVCNHCIWEVCSKEWAKMILRGFIHANPRGLETTIFFRDGELEALNKLAEGKDNANYRTGG